MNAPQPAPDPLALRLAAIRQGRARPGWHARLLELARDLTLADAGAVLGDAEGSWQALAPSDAAEVPEGWIRAAEAARASGGVAASDLGGGRWLMVVPIEPTAVLAVVVATTSAVDRALTRERLSMLAALAESATGSAALAGLAPSAAAAGAAIALLAAADPAIGLRDAAARLAGLLPAGTQLALGLASRGQITRLAVSDQPALPQGSAFARALRLLMEQALDSGAPVTLPARDAIPAAQRAWPDALRGQRLAALPAGGGGAAIVVLWHDREPAETQVLQSLLGPGLELLARVGGAPARPKVRRRPGGRTLLLAGLAVLVAAASLLPREDEVVASFVVQPDRVQVVTAPFDGVLEASDVRPGDSVAEGAVLARLVTRELALEIAATRARAANDLREAAIARAGGQPAQELIAELSARRAEAQLALLEYRIGLAEIRAPVAGVVLAGDLRRNLGQALTRGQTLFEIAPPGVLRAEILLPETRAHLVHAGQNGVLAPAADPASRYSVVIERVRPMAEIVQGRNVFRAVAILDTAGSQETAALRPGAEGVARVGVGETTWLAWVLRDPLLAVRRWLWI